VLIVAKIDRLARSVSDFVRFAEEASANGVSLVSVAETLDLSTPGGRFVATILAAFAELEAATISARVSEGRREVRRQRRHIGKAPWAYRIVDHPTLNGKGLEPIPERAEALRWAADEVLRGASLHQVARALDARGMAPPSGSWQTTALRRVLTSDGIAGRILTGGKPLVGEDGLPEQVWEPVLDVETLERLRILYPGSGAPPRRRAAALLSGIIKCSSCGRNCFLKHGRPRVDGSAVRRYTCNGDGGLCRPTLSMDADQADADVARQLLDTVGAMEMIEEREVSDSADATEVERAIIRTTEDMREPGADLGGLGTRLGTLVARREELASSPPVTRRVRVGTGETYRERWEGADLTGQRYLLESLLRGPILLQRRSPGDTAGDRLSIPWPWTDPTPQDLEDWATVSD
jgi:hypothetical protein